MSASGRVLLRELAFITLGLTLLTIHLTYPLAVHLGTLGRIDNTDAQFAIWNVAWVARTLVVDPRHVFDANIFYPHRNTLAYSENNLGAGILAIPVYWATRNPFAAHNFAGTLRNSGPDLPLPGFLADHAPINYAIVVWNCYEASRSA